MENYLTKDLYISSMLYAKKKEFIGLNKSGRSYWFIFRNNTDCEKMVSQYWLGKVTVDALSFVEAIRTLKNFIFTESEKEKMSY